MDPNRPTFEWSPGVQKSSTSKTSTSKTTGKDKNKEKGKFKTLMEELQDEIERGGPEAEFNTYPQGDSRDMPAASSVVDTFTDLPDEMEANQMVSPMEGRTSPVMISENEGVPDQPREHLISPIGNLISDPMHSSTPIQISKNSVNNIDTAQNLNNINSITEQRNQDYITIDLTKGYPSNLENNRDELNRYGNSGMDLSMENLVNNITRFSSIELARLLEVIAKEMKNRHSLQTKKRGNDDTEEEQARSRPRLDPPSYDPLRFHPPTFDPPRYDAYYFRTFDKSTLRMIIIDGENVAVGHARGRFFSVKGLQICIDYFVTRGHHVKAFVPRHRCDHGMNSDKIVLMALEREGLVLFTPSLVIDGKTVCSNDDRYIAQCANKFDGVIVSTDLYRDVVTDYSRWRQVIENRLLQYTWVRNYFMLPDEPLGPHGPSLARFLKRPSIF